MHIGQIRIRTQHCANTTAASSRFLSSADGKEGLKMTFKYEAKMSNSKYENIINNDYNN